MVDARYGAFTVRVDCSMCGQPIPVNAPDESAHCEHCQGDVALPKEMWRAVLRDFDDQHDSHHGTISKTHEVDGMSVHFAGRRASPACEKCSAPYPVDRFSDATSRDFFCVACGDPASTFPSPSWMRPLARTAAQIILTEPRGASASAKAQALAVSDAPRPVMMQCPACGGPLPITAASPRTVRCGHCTSDVYSPDDLWRRLHPTKTMREWFVRFEGETDAQRERAAEHVRQRQVGELREHRRREEDERRAQHAEAELACEEANEAESAVEVDRAKAGAYLALLPLYAVIGGAIVTLLACGAAEVEIPSPVFFVVGALQLASAVFAGIMAGRPIKARLRCDTNAMWGYHYMWLLFSMFVFPFGPIVFFVGIKRFFGTFMDARVNGQFVRGAKLTNRETWPAAFFFLAMSLGVAGEVASAIDYRGDAGHVSPSQTRPSGKRR